MRTTAPRRLVDELYVGATLASAAVLVAVIGWVGLRYLLRMTLWIGLND